MIAGKVLKNCPGNLKDHWPEHIPLVRPGHMALLNCKGGWEMGAAQPGSPREAGGLGGGAAESRAGGPGPAVPVLQMGPYVRSMAPCPHVK